MSLLARLGRKDEKNRQVRIFASGETKRSEEDGSYQSIKRMHDSWDNADNISSYGETVTISKAHKKGDNIICDLRVTHHVVWTNKPTTNVVDQYVGTTLNDDYKIISMGHGSTISK